MDPDPLLTSLSDDHGVQSATLLIAAVCCREIERILEILFDSHGVF